MFNPIIAFVWSAMSFAVAAVLVDMDGIVLNAVGWILAIFAVAAARHLEKGLIFVNGFVIFFSTAILLFSGMYIINNILTHGVIKAAILGCIFPMIVVSAIRFYRTFITNMIN